jgi:hypothetical protein
VSEIADWYKSAGFVGEDIGYKETECKTIPMGSDFCQQRGVFSIKMNGKDTKSWYYNCDFKFKNKTIAYPGMSPVTRKSVVSGKYSRI